MDVGMSFSMAVAMAMEMFARLTSTTRLETDPQHRAAQPYRHHAGGQPSHG
jgi:hypothetical protein